MYFIRYILFLVFSIGDKNQMVETTPAQKSLSCIKILKFKYIFCDESTNKLIGTDLNYEKDFIYFYFYCLIRVSRVWNIVEQVSTILGTVACNCIAILKNYNLLSKEYMEKKKILLLLLKLFHFYAILA